MELNGNSEPIDIAIETPTTRKNVEPPLSFAEPDFQSITPSTEPLDTVAEVAPTENIHLEVMSDATAVSGDIVNESIASENLDNELETTTSEPLPILTNLNVDEGTDQVKIVGLAEEQPLPTDNMADQPVYSVISESDILPTEPAESSAESNEHDIDNPSTPSVDDQADTFILETNPETLNFNTLTNEKDDIISEPSEPLTDIPVKDADSPATTEAEGILIPPTLPMSSENEILSIENDNIEIIPTSTDSSTSA